MRLANVLPLNDLALARVTGIVSRRLGFLAAIKYLKKLIKMDQSIVIEHRFNFSPTKVFPVCNKHYKNANKLSKYLITNLMDYLPMCLITRFINRECGTRDYDHVRSHLVQTGGDVSFFAPRSFSTLQNRHSCIDRAT